MTFADILRARATQHADLTAFIFLGGDGHEADRLTFSELHARACRVADVLVRNQLQGKPVILALPSGPDFVVALFACFIAGAIAVPIPDTIGKRTEHRVAAIIRDVGPAGIIAQEKSSNLGGLITGGIADGLAWIYMGDLPTVSGSAAIMPDVGADAPALIQYTSGSTSTPKGVMLSHANLIANNAAIATAFDHDASLRGVGWLPLYHDMGLVGHVLQPVYVGGLSVLMSPLRFLQRPLRWLKAISTWQATTSGGPSHAYELCLRALTHAEPDALDLSSWKVAYCGSEPVRAEILERFSHSFAPAGFRRQAWLPCYGLAEATLLVSGAHHPDGLRLAQTTPGGSRRHVSCGRPAAGSVSILEPSGSRLLAEGQVGEICVSGPSVAQGYWENPVETRRVFGTAPQALLRTGDLGFLSGGELFVSGRLKDVIIALGSKHAAEDIEATVRGGDAAFQDFSCAAFATEAAGMEQAVVIQEISAKNIDCGALDQARKNAMAAVTRDHGLRLFDFVLVKTGSLPRTSSGKIQRAQSRLMYQQKDFVRLDEIARPGAAVHADPALELER